MNFSKPASAVDQLLHSVSVTTTRLYYLLQLYTLFILQRLPTGALGFMLALWKYRFMMKGELLRTNASAEIAPRKDGSTTHTYLGNLIASQILGTPWTLSHSR
jgi:hypothetical protein